MIDLISLDVIFGKIVKDFFEIVYIEGGDLVKIVEECGMK